MNKKIYSIMAILIVILLSFLFISKIYLSSNKEKGIVDEELIIEEMKRVYTINELDEYLINLAEISKSPIIKEFSLNEWELNKEEKQKALLLNFVDKNNNITFIAIPSKHCFIFDEDGGMLYGGDIETFFSYIHPVGEHEDKYKSGEYQFCLRMSILNSDPYNLQKGIYYFDEIINIPKSCSIDMDDIDKECILEITKEGLNNSINKGFGVILDDNLSWVTEEIKQKVQKTKEVFEDMEFFYEMRQVFLINYKSDIGNFIIVVDLNDEILGLIEFSMTV